MVDGAGVSCYLMLWLVTMANPPSPIGPHLSRVVLLEKRAHRSTSFHVSQLTAKRYKVRVYKIELSHHRIERRRVLGEYIQRQVGPELQGKTPSMSKSFLLILRVILSPCDTVAARSGLSHRIYI